jgi:hypothetical protein
MNDMHLVLSLKSLAKETLEHAIPLIYSKGNANVISGAILKISTSKLDSSLLLSAIMDDEVFDEQTLIDAEFIEPYETHKNTETESVSKEGTPFK